MSIEKRAIEILAGCDTVILASISEDGCPRSCLMSKSGFNGCGEIFFATSASSCKAAQFKRNPKAGVCYFDSCDSISLTGNVKILDDMETKKNFWQDWYIDHFPGGPDDPDYCVIKFNAEKGTFWIDDEFMDGIFTNKGLELKYRHCQSCGMPLGSDELLGTDSDGSRSGEYCCYCLKDGAFTADCTMDEMIEFCVPHMVAAHPEMNQDEARAAMKKFFPSLKRWKK